MAVGSRKGLTQPTSCELISRVRVLLRVGADDVDRKVGAARADGTSRPEWRLTGQDGKGVGVELLFQPKLDEASGEPLATDWVIGRSHESADRVVSDASVSGVHARMRYAPGRGLEICDAGSSNGTKLDGKPVSTSFVPLDGARVVQLGTLKLQVNTRT